MVVGTVDIRSKECGHELELWVELEVGVGGHVVAANVLRMAVLDCGGDGWSHCRWWWWPCSTRNWWW